MIEIPKIVVPNSNHVVHIIQLAFIGNLKNRHERIVFIAMIGCIETLVEKIITGNHHQTILILAFAILAVLQRHALDGQIAIIEQIVNPDERFCNIPLAKNHVDFAIEAIAHWMIVDKGFIQIDRLRLEQIIIGFIARNRFGKSISKITRREFHASGKLFIDPRIKTETQSRAIAVTRVIDGIGCFFSLLRFIAKANISAPVQLRRMSVLVAANTRKRDEHQCFFHDLLFVVCCQLKLVPIFF